MTNRHKSPLPAKKKATENVKITVIDGHTLNPGDLSWKDLEEFGELVVYERTAVEEILERSADADIVITNKTPFSRGVIAQLPQLKCIGVSATGYNIVAIPLAAGVLAPIGILLSPAIGALFMSLSTVIVAINAQLMRRSTLMGSA